jgi:small subunit ribosomal protein S4
MALRTNTRSAAADVVPLHPAYGFRLRRQKHPVGVRGGPRRAPRGHTLDRVDRQRVRAAYGLRGRQVTRALAAAARQPGDAAENLAAELEQRLDALVCRAGFARSTAEARGLVAHNTFTVDGGKVNRPSYLVRPGQIIEVRPERRCRARIAAAVTGRVAGDAPPYLLVDPRRFTATLIRQPHRQEVPPLQDVALTVHAEPEVTR